MPWELVRCWVKGESALEGTGPACRCLTQQGGVEPGYNSKCRGWSGRRKRGMSLGLGSSWSPRHSAGGRADADADPEALQGLSVRLQRASKNLG